MRLLADLRENVLFEERVNGFGRNGIKLVVNGNADALLALAHTESAAELNVIRERVFVYERLKSFNNLS